MASSQTTKQQKLLVWGFTFWRKPCRALLISNTHFTACCLVTLVYNVTFLPIELTFFSCVAHELVRGPRDPGSFDILGRSVWLSPWPMCWPLCCPSWPPWTAFPWWACGSWTPGLVSGTPPALSSWWLPLSCWLSTVRSKSCDVKWKVKPSQPCCGNCYPESWLTVHL